MGLSLVCLKAKTTTKVTFQVMCHNLRILVYLQLLIKSKKYTSRHISLKGVENICGQSKQNCKEQVCRKRTNVPFISVAKAWFLIFASASPTLQYV